MWSLAHVCYFPMCSAVDVGIAVLQGQHAHMAGNIMAFFLVSGCSLGAAAGFLWLL